MAVIKFLLSKGIVNDNDALITQANSIAFSFDCFMMTDSNDSTKIHKELIQLCAKYLINNVSFRNRIASQRIGGKHDQEIVQLFLNAFKLNA